MSQYWQKNNTNDNINFCLPALYVRKPKMFTKTRKMAFMKRIRLFLRRK